MFSPAIIYLDENENYIGLCSGQINVMVNELAPGIHFAQLKLLKTTRTKEYSKKPNFNKQMHYDEFRYKFFLEWSYMDDISDEYYGITTIEEAEKPDRPIDTRRNEPCRICARQMGKSATHRGHEGVTNCECKNMWNGKSCRTNTALKCRFPGCGKKFLCSTTNHFKKEEAIKHLRDDHGINSEKLKDLTFIKGFLDDYVSKMMDAVYSRYHYKFEYLARREENKIVGNARCQEVYAKWFKLNRIITRDERNKLERTWELEFAERFKMPENYNQHKKILSEALIKEIESRKNKNKLMRLYQKCRVVESIQWDSAKIYKYLN